VRCWGEGANGQLGSCGLEAIGDDETPGSVAPVDFGVPGSAAPACASAPEPFPAPPPAGAAAPAPIAIGPPPRVRLPPVAPIVPDIGRPPLAAVAALAAQRRRAAALRTCLGPVARRASDERRPVLRRPAPERAGAVRRLTRSAARRRRTCLARHGRTPGRVSTVAVRAAGRRTITLTFRATGTESTKAPAARGYLVKQSRRPIRSANDFRRADALCKGACSFKVVEVGEKVTLKITDLRRGSTYYYAVAARDNVSARIGPRSETVTARTR